MDLMQEVRKRFLDRLDQPWNEEDPRLDFGSAALPYFVDAFQLESNAADRVRLIRIICQFRDTTALESLATALSSAQVELWKESLDGLVALGDGQAVTI